MEQLEKQTYLMKLMLVLMRDRKARQAQVRNVGYLREYGELPEELGVYTLGQMSDDEIAALANQVGIKKRPAVGKSDIYMNDLGYILVASEHHVVLIDQASQQQLVALAEHLQLPIITEQLAQLKEQSPITETITERSVSGNISSGSELSETSQLEADSADHLSRYHVKLAELVGNSEAHRKAWTQLIVHWWCRGSIEEPSTFPAELVLCFNDPMNMNTWDIYEPDVYLQEIWEQICIVVERDGRLSIHKQ